MLRVGHSPDEIPITRRPPSLLLNPSNTTLNASNNAVFSSPSFRPRIRWSNALCRSRAMLYNSHVYRLLCEIEAPQNRTLTDLEIWAPPRVSPFAPVIKDGRLALW